MEVYNRKHIFYKKVTLIQEFAIKRLNYFYTYHTKYRF